MTLDKEEHRQFLINLVAAANAQGNVDQLRVFVNMATEVQKAVEFAVVLKPLTEEAY